jgi:L-alanine-DL-glutamate epimerase-like enolase superfamily enzyme
MRITKVEAIPFRLPVRREFRWAGLHADLGSFVLVRIHTDSGLVGLGEATPLPDWGGDFGRRAGETQQTVVSMVTKILAPVLTGRDPTSVEMLVADMDRVLWGHNYAKAAIDIALHDLWGKAMQQPLYAALGGAVRPAVPLAHMVGLMPDQEAVAEGTGAIADGLGALQVKGGENPERDIRVLKSLRDSVGPDVVLRLDANQGYGRAKEAISIVRKLGPGVLDMLEQPVTGLRDMAAVTKAIDLTVIADESCWDPHDALEVVQAEAADAISIYLAKAGGIARARQVAAIASAAGLPCDVNGSIESGIGNAANVHFALATPAVTLASVIPVSAPAGFHPFQVGGAYYDDDIIREPFKAEDGALLPLEAPGLGVELDEEKLERFRAD